MMLSSAYFLSDIMIGNFAMPIRYEWAIEMALVIKKDYCFRLEFYLLHSYVEL